jgi:hypothetical protein
LLIRIFVATGFNLSKDSLLDQKIGGSNSSALDILFLSHLVKRMLKISMSFAIFATGPLAIALSDREPLEERTG